MKTKFLFASLMASLIFSMTPAQTQRTPQWLFVRSLTSDDKSDTLQIYYLSNDKRVPPYPNRVLIKSRTDTIEEIQVENGSSQRMTDGSFLIKRTPGQNFREFHLKLIGHRIWDYDISIMTPKSLDFTLKAYFTLKNREAPNYTIDDIIRNK